MDRDRDAVPPGRSPAYVVRTCTLDVVTTSHVVEPSEIKPLGPATIRYCRGPHDQAMSESRLDVVLPVEPVGVPRAFSCGPCGERGLDFIEEGGLRARVVVIVALADVEIG